MPALSDRQKGNRCTPRSDRNTPRLPPEAVPVSRRRRREKYGQASLWRQGSCRSPQAGSPPPQEPVSRPLLPWTPSFPSARSAGGSLRCAPVSTDRWYPQTALSHYYPGYGPAHMLRFRKSLLSWSVLLSSAQASLRRILFGEAPSRAFNLKIDVFEN